MSPEFRKKVEQAWNEIPKNDHLTLLKNRVKIRMVKRSENEAASVGLYNPSTNEITVGEVVYAQKGGIRISYPNSDVAGALKHELGHALYKAWHIENLSSFQETYKREAANVPHDQLDQLGHFLGDDGPTEVFAELYASLYGRSSGRIDMLKASFPELSRLVNDVVLRNQ